MTADPDTEPTPPNTRAERVLHFLHIGKTGGTAVKHALGGHYRGMHCRIRLHSHKVRLRDIPAGESVMFFVRNPMTKFVSAFYSRQRKGQPRRDTPWRPEEAKAFARFSTPRQLAEGLSSSSEEERHGAIHAMKNIGHVRDSYWDWFVDEAYFQSRMNDIYFIGFQETLSADFEVLKRKAGLPESIILPEDDVMAHRSPPGLDTYLGEVAEANLRDWYARDLKFVALCRQLASSINGIAELPVAEAEAGS